jgi:hypothetical protein
MSEWHRATRYPLHKKEKQMTTPTPTEARAWNLVRNLKKTVWTGDGHDRVDAMAEINLLRRGKHPDFPPGFCVPVNMEKRPTLDSAMKEVAMQVFHHVATHDVGIFFRRPGLEVTVNRAPTKDKPFANGDDVDRVMEALKDIARRLTPLEEKYGITQNVASKGPAAPVALDPVSAHRVATQAYILQQARANQRRGFEAGLCPQHPTDAAEENREQQQQIRSTPHHPDYSTDPRDVTHDARHLPHRMIARGGHLTFANAKALRDNIKQNAEPRAIRDKEQTLMADVLHAIDQKYGDEK